MKDINKSDYKKLWINFDSSDKAMKLIPILYEMDMFEISLLTLESDVDNDLLNLLDDLNWDVEVVFLKDYMTDNNLILSKFLNDFKSIDLLNLSNFENLSEFFEENEDALNSLEDVFLYDKYVKSKKSNLELLDQINVFMITDDTLNKHDYSDILDGILDSNYEIMIEDLFVLYAYCKKDHFIYAETSIRIDEDNNMIENEGIDCYVSITYNVDKFKEFLEGVII